MFGVKVAANLFTNLDEVIRSLDGILIYVSTCEAFWTNLEDVIHTTARRYYVAEEETMSMRCQAYYIFV